MHAHASRVSARRLTAALIITTLALTLVVPAASAAPKTKLISQAGGGQSGSESVHPDISDNGNLVVFHTAGKLISTDGNGVRDVYRRVVSSAKTKLVSRAHDGGIADAESRSPNVSANGRYVVFKSRATDLTTSAVTNYQCYRRDLVTGVTKLVSKGPSGPSSSDCGGPRVSANGRYVVFSTNATNLTSKPTHSKEQVYLRDMKLGKTYLMSKSKGQAGDDHSGDPVVSADGRYVAFESEATNLWSGDERGQRQVFLRDRKLGKTVLISKNPAKNKAGDGMSGDVAMSSDGKILVFESEAKNLIKWGKDSNGKKDIYKYDRNQKKMSRVSVNWKGRQLTGSTCVGSEDPDISANGKVIVFGSDQTNVIKGGTSGLYTHIYRRGPLPSSIKLVSKNNKGAKGDGWSRLPKVSADGKYVTYQSSATNLAKGGDDNGNTSDVFRSGPF